MLLTICTIRQLPQAFGLGNSLRQFTADGKGEPMLIGLVDDLTHLPSGFVSPYPLLSIGELLPADQISALSAMYTPTEFSAACKPLFIAEAFRRYPEADKLVYADPNIQLLHSLAPIWSLLDTANILLTPFITRNPANGSTDEGWPDEKFFQNIGLYSSDFLAFRRSTETDRLLDWWDNRVRERAFINFCEGHCLDQLWLMHVPVMFRGVTIVKNPGWHVGLWNLHERTIQLRENHRLVSGPTGQNEPLLFVNFKGLSNPDEGFFPHQTRVRLADRPEINSLLTSYRQLISNDLSSALGLVNPAYGQQPEPLVLRGWRYATIKSMRTVTRFLDQVYIPVIK
ncbi:hypothetical protein GO730_36600 [Spirosoma sp. HMF3257]|uniref:Glycosyl transferase n=1 Tax=Spirosoma telluris TaxID=2183553 RepID=A0A327NWH8_9BACT|nr:hypothetical protein [Spirosoma telluris]RAI78224.1 hypothetical protein HMF3257_36530 [Spirosoma telluris]